MQLIKILACMQMSLIISFVLRLSRWRRILEMVHLFHVYLVAHVLY